MEPPLFARITVAVDGSDHAGHALGLGIDLARRYASSLSILAVAPLAAVYVAPSEPFIATAIPPSDMPRYQAIVEAAVKRAEGAGVTRVTGVCIDGVVTEEILAHLEKYPSDLLVIGSRGLSTTERILLGSVSTAMVNHAPCPVLVVRPTVTKPAG